MKKEDIESIYSLSPIQQGILFHILASPESGMYFEQFSRVWPFPVLSPHIFQEALQKMLERHTILRTAFYWEEAEQPLQVVHKNVKINIEHKDWRNLSPEAQEKELEILMSQDRQRGFDLRQPPLLRVTLIQLEQETYRILWSHHHLLLDGWSFYLLFEEFIAASKAISEKQEPVFPPALPYRNYVSFIRQQDMSQAESYWRKYLHGFSNPNVLGIDKNPESLMVQKEEEYQEIQVILPPSFSKGLQTFCRENRLTLSTLLQAAWALLLGHYSSQEDIIFGSTVAGRPPGLPGVETMIGVFINTLPVRAKIEPQSPLLQWIKEFQKQQAEMRQYESTPLIQIQGWSNVHRGLPLFHSIVVVESYPVQSYGQLARMKNLKVFQRTNYPLTVVIEPGEEIMIRLTYNRQRFNHKAIERLLNHYQNILQQMPSRAESKVCEISAITQAEKEKIQNTWNSCKQYPQTKCLHELFEDQVRKTPEATALAFEGKGMSYRELNEASNQLAHALQENGVGPEVLVGLAMEPSFELMIGILGILKAGGAYVAMDPHYPSERLHFMIEDTMIDVLVTQSHLSDTLPANKAKIVCVDESRKTLEKYSKDSVCSKAKPENLIYIIYTSGSTGKPKGVLVTHHNVARLMEATHPWYGFDSSDVWTLFHSYAFDFTVWEMWGALLYGGKLVIVPHSVRRSFDLFYDLLVQERVTVLNQTPSAFYQLILAEEAKGTKGNLSLRYVIFGGEALKMENLKPWLALHGDEKPKLVNMYGITETTVHVTYRPISKSDLESDSASVIGVPIPDLYVYLLNASRQFVPMGVPGEIYVGGAGVARGYWNRKELTQERFIVDPFIIGNPNARLYKSGDMARCLDNGELDFLGRGDNQFKVRGFRIEPGEIESILKEHAAVRESVVLLKEYAPGDNRVVAYIIPDSQKAPVVWQFLAMTKQGKTKEKQHYELPNGMLLFHKNKNETDFLYTEIFGEQSYLKHGISVQKGDTIVDIGANIGLFSLMVSQISSDVRIYAFEPIPSVCDILKLNMELYGLDAKVFCCGISDKEKSDRFISYPYVSILSGQSADPKEVREVVKNFVLNQQKEEGSEMTPEQIEELLNARLKSEEITCSFYPLSKIIKENQIEKIDLLKVDVEKSELAVLMGIEKEDWQKIQQIVIEVHDVEGILEKIQGILVQQGFEIAIEKETSLQATNLYNIYAWRAKREVLPEAEKIEWKSPGHLIGDLRSFAKKGLPEHMIPSAFVLLDSFPLTVNGKLDRDALLTPEKTRLGMEKWIAPQSEMEQKIAALWEQVLQIKEIGIDDNFFDLGGHSLLLVRVYSQLKHIIKRPFTMTELFEYPTIRSLAHYLSQTQESVLSLNAVDDRVKKQQEAMNRQQKLMQQARQKNKKEDEE